MKKGGYAKKTATLTEIHFMYGGYHKGREFGGELGGENRCRS